MSKKNIIIVSKKPFSIQNAIWKADNQDQQLSNSPLATKVGKQLRKEKTTAIARYAHKNKTKSLT